LFKSLRFRLAFIIVSLAVGPLLLAAIFLTWHSVIYLEQQSQSMLHEVAVGVGNEIRSFIEEQIYHLILTHKLYGIELLYPEQQRTILNNLVFDQQVYHDIALLNPDGQELMRLSRSMVYLGKDLQNRATQKEFLFPATHNDPYFSAIRFDRKIQEPLVTISVPLVDLRNGKLAYVLTGRLRFKKIWDLLANIDIPGEGDVYVVDQEKQVVAHRNPSVVLRGTTYNLPEVTGRAKGLSGTDVIISWDLVQFGDQKLNIVAEQPISRALVLITNHFRIGITITSLVILIALFFVVLAIRHFVRPVEFLATAARAISYGDYSQRVKVTSQDEVGTLASSFNKMSRDLEKYHNKMEELVKMRTDELSQANKQLQVSLEKIKTLSGFLPICASCKNIRDDKGYWNKIESYIEEHSKAEFSHSICPECAKKLYPEFYKAGYPDKKG
jgi:HAMP domain-containing protein